MTEREIIINWLVSRPDDEARPQFFRLAMQSIGVTKLEDEDPMTKKVFQKVEALTVDFENAFFQKDPAKLRKYYECLSPQSLVEAFDGWACHTYR